MSFSSLTYLLFFPLVFGVYWSLRRPRAQNLVLLLASYVFYGWWDPRFLGLIVASSLVDFVAARGIDAARADGPSPSPGRRRAWVSLSVVTNVGLLGFFKYFDFFQENLIALAASAGWHLDPFTLRIVLPVGISFYTFQTMSYTLDVFRGRLRASARLLDYLTYVAFFPQLVAGPIERATNLLPQFAARRSFEYERTVSGARQALWGFFKKMVLADNLALLSFRAYANLEAASGAELAVGTLAFAFQIYCDFSAYSDIAIGSARALGIDLMQNFDHPYFSRSVAEFWRRWHISLSSWFRDYVYVPLGGNRRGRGRTLVNLLVVMALSGLWHGASWTFVVWGLLHGAALVLGVLWAARRGGDGRPGAGRSGDGRSGDGRRGDELAGGPGWLPAPGALLRMAATFLFVTVGWVFFRARSLSDAMLVLRKLFLEPWGEAAGDAPGLAMPVSFVAGGCAALLLLEWCTRGRPHPLAAVAGWPKAARWLAYTLLFWVTFLGNATNPQPFVYFQF